MNDRHLLETVLAKEEPSPEAVARSRRQLVNRISSGPVRRHRTRWLAAGVGVSAVAAAAAVVVATAPAPPQAPQVGKAASPGGKTVSGAQVLLAAATVAARSPEGSGTYWHLTVSGTDPAIGPVDYWTKPDGRVWFRGVKTGGKVVKWDDQPKPFSLVAVDLTLDQLRRLPTDPAALKAWIDKAEEHTTATSSGGPFTANDKKVATFQSLISLVSTLPAPPAVRAAAFRAIAAYPGVKNLGPVPGGQGLLIPPDGDRLVVDPATGRVNRTSTYILGGGARYIIPPPDTESIHAEWTNTLPG